MPVAKGVWMKVLQTIGQVLVQAAKHDDQKTLVQILALLDSGSLLREIIETQFLVPSVLEQLEGKTEDMLAFLRVLGMVLQASNKCTFKILRFISDYKHLLDPMAHLSQKSLRTRALEVAFRFFEAQPFSRQFWDPKALFSLNGDNKSNLPIKLMLEYTRRMLYDPSSRTQPSDHS